MDWPHLVYYLVLVAVLICGLLINVFGLPGLWLMLAGVGGYAWVTDLRYIGYAWLGTLLGLTLVAEALEFLAAGAGAKQAGGSKRGMVGAIIGGLLGGLIFSIPVPIIGTIIGVCLGTFVGALATEVLVGKEVDQSVRIGVGAAKGRLYGTIIKLMFGFLILALALWRCFPIGGTPATAAPPAATAPAPPTTLPANTVPATLPNVGR